MRISEILESIDAERVNIHLTKMIDNLAKQAKMFSDRVQVFGYEKARSDLLATIVEVDALVVFIAQGNLSSRKILEKYLALKQKVTSDMNNGI